MMNLELRDKLEVIINELDYLDDRIVHKLPDLTYEYELYEASKLLNKLLERIKE